MRCLHINFSGGNVCIEYATLGTPLVGNINLDYQRNLFPDISFEYNDTENIITVSSYSLFEDLHYYFTFTIGDIIWQNMENAERRIDELRVYCYETGQIWEFDSDQVKIPIKPLNYLRHYFNRRNNLKKLYKLLSDFE